MSDAAQDSTRARRGISFSFATRGVGYTARRRQPSQGRASTLYKLSRGSPGVRCGRRGEDLIQHHGRH